MIRKLIAVSMFVATATLAEDAGAKAAPAAPAPAAAEPSAASALTVDEAKLGTGVENNAVVGEGTTFKADDSKAYLWIKLHGAKDTEIKTVWYRGADKISEVTLPVKYDPQTTWAYKTLRKGYPGDYKVDVVDSAGTVLKSVSFKVEE